MTPLRIGYDVTPLAGRRTGVGNYTEAVLRHMLPFASGMQFHAFSSGRHRIDASTLGIASHRHVPLPTRALYALWNSTGLPRADKLVGGVDVFHATNYFLPPVASARTVLSIYDLAFLKHPEWCSPKIVGPFSRAVRQHALHADAIVACSAATRDDIVSLLGVDSARIHVVHGAVDIPAHLPERDASAKLLARDLGIHTPFLLFVSTLEPRKNIEGILHAFALAAPHIPHTLVLAGGTGWGMEGLPALLQSLQLGDRVRLLGYVTQPEHLPALYTAADAFFFPSHYEGFGLPLLEAMAHGCPVITARNSSLPEVAGDAARYVDPNDHQAMADVLSEVAQDAALRDTLSAAGRTRARGFSWQDAATRTLDLYRSLV